MRTFGKASKKFPEKVPFVAESRSERSSVPSWSLLANLGSRLKLNPLSSVRDCNMRSRSGNGLGPLYTAFDSRRALISSNRACACVDIWYGPCAASCGDESTETGSRVGGGKPGGADKPGGTAGNPGGTTGAGAGDGAEESGGEVGGVGSFSIGATTSVSLSSGEAKTGEGDTGRSFGFGGFELTVGLSARCGVDAPAGVAGRDSESTEGALFEIAEGRFSRRLGKEDPIVLLEAVRCVRGVIGVRRVWRLIAG